ncbi:MAG: hypothetical protein ACK5PW_05180 [Burkholderiales bacterium]
MTAVVAGLAGTFVAGAATLAVDFGDAPVFDVEREGAAACTGALDAFEDLDDDVLPDVALVAAIGDAVLAEPRGATALTVSFPVERPPLDAAPAAEVAAFAVAAFAVAALETALVAPARIGPAVFGAAFGGAFGAALDPVFVVALETAFEAGFRAVAIVAAGRLGLVLALLTTGPRYVNRENLLFYQVPSGDVRAFRSAWSSA